MSLDTVYVVVGAYHHDGETNREVVDVYATEEGADDAAASLAQRDPGDEFHVVEKEVKRSATELE